MDDEGNWFVWALLAMLCALFAIFVPLPGLGGGLVYEPLPLFFYGASIVGMVGFGIHAFVTWKIERDRS